MGGDVDDRPWAGLITADDATVGRLAETLEIRAAETRQQAMLHEYLADVAFPESARVLEVGTGTGAVARVLARWPSVREVVGVDPTPGFVRRAKELASGIENLTFRVADGRELPFESGVFDCVVFHTTLCHLPGPHLALTEANRALRSGGWVVVFDGDYTTITVALADNDPLQSCVEAVLTAGLENRWLVRRLPAMVRGAGFEVRQFRSHGYVQTSDASYMLTIIDRGADLLASSGCISRDLCGALKAEGRQRVTDGRFFGQISYASLAAVKP
jgi:ubiquinone/menaquinone biosynthesis C-methylase UbiE